jgi:ribose-phosphate pyrophosphokinase
MKTLNLTDIDKSNIKYQIINYPDGQKDIVIDYKSGFTTNSEDTHFKNTIPIVQIKSRLNNAEDLLIIICATKALRNLKVKEIHLYTPYIMGLRSDRLFQEGGNRYVKDIIAPLLNAQNFESVTCIDPHSDVAENCINKLEKISNLELVEFTFDQIRNDNHLKGSSSYTINNNAILVSPDAGASKKIYKLAEQIGYKGDIITCSKDRDKDGKLTKTFVPMNKIHDTCKDIIIIDDICDGGGTFINIAKEIKDKYFKNKIYLVVTHGIFSKGFGELQQYFDAIYTTNSYKQLNPDTQVFVKQLNVF